MKKISQVLVWLVIPVVAACATGTTESKSSRTNLASSLDQWIKGQELKSWGHLQKVISPVEPKNDGDPQPLRGIVVAALSKKDPDYYFHWVRDSSSTMKTIVQVLVEQRPYASSEKIHSMMRDYLKLSRSLQQQESAFGMGEPRYTVMGKADTIPWSRPQYDGPALRALTVLDYLRLLEKQKTNGENRRLAIEILKTDLDFVAHVWNERGFDIWEELKAENYHTRLVQLAALEKGVEWFQRQKLYLKSLAKYRQVARNLERELNDHWDPTKGYLRSQLVIVATDGYTAKKTDLDSAVIVAVVNADRKDGNHSVLDPQVQATLRVLSNYFLENYPLNQKKDSSMGLAFGRYPGDVYYGGNPWFLITADIARFYYRLSSRMQAGNALEVTSKNLEFCRDFLQGTGNGLQAGMKLDSAHPLHKKLAELFFEEGEKIMRLLQAYAPADGQLYEQFDKATGAPVSSQGLGWAHASMIEAILERSLAERNP